MYVNMWLYGYIYIYIYIFIHIVICIYIYMQNYQLPVNVKVRIPHPQSGDSQGQETFLAPSAYKQTRIYDKKCSNHHLPYQL